MGDLSFALPGASHVVTHGEVSCLVDVPQVIFAYLLKHLLLFVLLVRCRDARDLLG